MTQPLHADLGPPSNSGSYLSLRFALAVNRALSWGMPEHKRFAYLAETDADWEAMMVERGSLPVFRRTLRGLPGWAWTRLSERDTTALPAALGIGLIGLGGITSSLQPTAYSTQTRAFMALASFGLLLTSITLLRTPRQIIMRRFRVPTLAAAIGILGIGINMPKPTHWEYELEALNNPIIDIMTRSGVVMFGIGCAIAAVGAFFVLGRRTLVTSMAVATVGLALIGVSQIIWGIWDTSVDLPLASSTILTGLAALSLVHVLPRLRHLEIQG